MRRNMPEWVNDNPCSMMDSVILGAKSERTLRAQGSWGGLAPIKKERPPGLDDSRVSKSGSFLLSHLV